MERLEIEIAAAAGVTPTASFPEGTKLQATQPDGEVIEWTITGAEVGGKFTNHVEGYEHTSLRLFLSRDIPKDGRP